jgi:hypothetical protein
MFFALEMPIHLLFALALLPLALPFIVLEGLRLGLQAEPNAIEPHQGRDLREGGTMRLLKQGCDLIDPVVDRP